MKTDQEVYNYLVASLKSPELFFLTKDSLLSHVMTCFYFLGIDRSKHNVYVMFAPPSPTSFLNVNIVDQFVKEDIDTVDNLSDRYWVSAILAWVNRVLSDSHKEIIIETCESLEEDNEDDKTAHNKSV